MADNLGMDKDFEEFMKKISEMAAQHIKQQNSITLKKSTKGIYSWEVKVYGENLIGQLENTNNSLNEKFGEKNGKEN